MLAPKKTKYQKQFRGRRKGKAIRGHSIDFGEYGLKAEAVAWITSRQIEAARKVIVHHTKRGGKVWIRIFPDKPVTAKPQEVRMGGGKGAIDHYVAVVKPGRMMFELSGLDRETAVKALKMASHKLPIKTKVVSKEEAA